MQLPAGRKFHLEVVDDDMARVLRAKTGTERLAIASGMYSSARRMLVSHLKSEHPLWSDKQVADEASRRLSHGAVSAGRLPVSSP